MSKPFLIISGKAFPVSLFIHFTISKTIIHDSKKNYLSSVSKQANNKYSKSIALEVTGGEQ